MKKIIILICLFQPILNLYAQHNTGENGKEQQYKTIQSGYTPDIDIILPKQYTLRKFAPVAGNQGELGTCTAWATAYCARTICESIALDRNDSLLSTMEAFSPIFLYQLIKNNSDIKCTKGSVINEGLEKLKTIGVPKFKTIDYNCSITLTSRDYQNALPFKIKEFYRLENNDIIKEIKTHLFQNHPVVFALMTTPTFNNMWSGLEEWKPSSSEINAKKIYNNSNSTITDTSLLTGGHALCIIGYRETSTGGFFEVQNSWGTGWGKNGRFTISYDNFLVMYTKYSCSAIVPDDKIEPTYSHDGNLELLIENKTTNKLDTLKLTKKLIVNNQQGDMKRANNFFSTSKTFKYGDKIKLLFKSSKQSYVYAFIYDVDIKKSKQLFPFNGLNPYINFSNYYMNVPGDGSYIQFGKQKGKKYLVILLSPREVDVEALKNVENNPDFNVFDALQKNFSDRIVLGKEFKSIQKFESQFSVLTRKKDYIIPLFIEIIEN